MNSLKRYLYKLQDLCGGSRALAMLLIVNVALWALLAGAEGIMRLSGVSGNHLEEVTTLCSDMRVFVTRPWTIATYMVTHFSVLHLLFNMLWLYWFGRMLSDTCRDRDVLRIYIFAGLAGGIAYLAASAVTSGSPMTFLAGSSASVLGVMAAVAIRMPSRRIGLFLLGEVKLKWVAAGCVVLTLLGSSGGGIPTQCAHIGGLATGIAWFPMAGLFLHRNHTESRSSGMRHNLRRDRRINAGAAADAMRNAQPDMDRLDELLDKIRSSGYDSLSRKEKAELNYISSRIET